MSEISLDPHSGSVALSLSSKSRLPSDINSASEVKDPYMKRRPVEGCKKEAAPNISPHVTSQLVTWVTLMQMIASRLPGFSHGSKLVPTPHFSGGFLKSNNAGA